MADLRDLLGVKVEKGFLQNLDNGQINQFLFNPVQLEERHKPKYVFHPSPGLSHERMQYVGNKNVVIPLELIFDELVFARARAAAGISRFDVQGTQILEGIRTGNDVEIWRRRLMEITYPRRNRGSILQSSPPPVLFNWPGMFNMRVRVTDLRMRTVQFKTGRPAPRIMIANVVLTEEPCGRLFSEDMMRLGTFRAWGGRLDCTEEAR